LQPFRQELVGLESDKLLKQNRPRKKCESVVKKPLKRRCCVLTEVKRLWN
jgi:hypothetical protein